MLRGLPAQQIESDLSALITWVKGRQVANQPSTAVTLVLTTIQPLGLASGDSRETVRNDVNDWILHDSGADTVIDTTTAAGDPAKTAAAVANGLTESGL